jgi:hypothetical protein
VRSATQISARPIQQVAKMVGMDESALHRIARMAERIRSDERQRLLSIIDFRGLPLLPSLFEELAAVPSATKRLELAQKAIREGLIVRQLRASIHDTVVATLR